MRAPAARPALHAAVLRALARRVAVEGEAAHGVAGVVVPAAPQRAEADLLGGVAQHAVGEVRVDGDLGHVLGVGLQPVDHDGGGVRTRALLLVHAPHALVNL